MTVKVPGAKSSPVWQRLEQWLGEKRNRQKYYFTDFREEDEEFLTRGVIIARWDDASEQPARYYNSEKKWGVFGAHEGCSEDPMIYRSFHEAIQALELLRKQSPKSKIGLVIWVYPRYQELYLPLRQSNPAP